jgi:hypothetical protein
MFGTTNDLELVFFQILEYVLLVEHFQIKHFQILEHIRFYLGMLNLYKNYDQFIQGLAETTCDSHFYRLPAPVTHVNTNPGLAVKVICRFT